MRRPFLYTVFVCMIGILFGLFYISFVRESADFVKYKRVQVGMSVEEVQAILGPGTPIDQVNVPGTVVPVNPEEAEAAIERARRAGGSPPTVREYATRIKPLVEGDYILRWLNDTTGERILVAFIDGKVSKKDYFDPNYF